MKRSIVARIFAPVSPQQLVDDYFERRPLHVRGRHDKYEFLFRQEQFKDGLDRATEIRAVFAGLWQAAIDPADIKEMYRAGATICVTGMERVHRALADAARRIARELHYPGSVSFRAYLSPAGRGFDLHYDARIATTLQIAGTKRWWYSTTPAIPFPRANSPRPLAHRAGPKPPSLRSLRSVVLRPGDLLCLPAGTWHRARAETDSLALNLAFDHNTASVIDAIADAVEARLDHDEAWRRPPRPSIARRRRMTPEAEADLRARIDLVQRELTAIRDDPAALVQLWRASFTPPFTS
jgi:ribosomal protein L16 Arg81 hydroxylase